MRRESRLTSAGGTAGSGSPLPEPPPSVRIDPAEPIDRIEPAEPTERIEPAEPIERIDPADPTDPSEPTENADQADATEAAAFQLSTENREPPEATEARFPTRSSWSIVSWTASVRVIARMSRGPVEGRWSGGRWWFVVQRRPGRWRWARCIPGSRIR